MQLWVHKQIIFVHISLDKLLVLLSVAATNNQEVLASDEPDELLEPEDFTLDWADLSLLKFFEITCGCFLSLFNGKLSRIDSLHLLLIGLFANLEVLLDVELGRDA